VGVTAQKHIHPTIALNKLQIKSRFMGHLAIEDI